MRFRQSAYWSAIHGTISVLNEFMQDPVESRKTVFIKYLTLFQRETDINLFVLDFDNFGEKLKAEDDFTMREMPAYRLTGKIVVIKFIENKFESTK